MRGALRMLRRRPQLFAAWLALLALPAILATLPLDLALAPVLDLRPAADALVRAPADDGLWQELLAGQPMLRPLAVGSLLTALVVGIPLVWLLCGHVAAVALDSPLPARVVAARNLGVMLVALPLRLAPWLVAGPLAARAAQAATLAELGPWVAAAACAYLGGAALVTVIVDLARGAALAAPDDGPWRALREGLRAARRQPRTLAWLCLLELCLATLAALPVAASRPVGVFGGFGAAVALAALALRAAGGVVGVACAAATGAASRSA